MLTLTDDITSGSLFSGFGGLDRAIERVFGARTVWVSDIEPGPRKVLAHRWPGVPNLGDITAVDWDTVPEVDLAGGGSPCQDISSAGRMAGMVEGTRSNLWVEMREAIRHLRPMFVVWENVQAARSTKAASRYWPDHIDRCIAHHLAVSKETSHAPTKARHRRAAHRLMEQRARRVGVPYPKPALRALGRVLGDVADLGYDTVWVSLPASGVGAPHLRKRYFVLAADARGQSWLERRFAATSQAPRGGALGEFAGRDRAPVALLPTTTTRDYKNVGSADGFDRRSKGHAQPLPEVVAHLLPTPSAGNFNDGENPDEWEARRQRIKATGVNGNGMGVGSRYPTSRSAGPNPSVADSTGGHERRGGDRGGELLLKGIAKADQWGKYAPAITRWEQVLGRQAPPATITGARGNPKLNPEFASWMMGAPAGWITDVPGVTDNEALRMAGNGVVEQQAVEALLWCIEQFLTVIEAERSAA